MVDQNLLSYIRQCRELGQSDENIRSMLLSRGWQIADLDEAFRSMAQATSPSPTPQGIFHDTDVEKASPQVKYEGFSPLKIGIIVGAVVLVIGGLIGSIFAYTKLTKKADNTKSAGENKKTEAPKQTTEGYLDCGQDMNCFIEASNECKKAKVTHTLNIEIFEIKQATTSRYEIKGKEGERCIFYHKTEKIELNFPSSVPEETQKIQKEQYKTLEGKEGTCKYAPSELAPMLKSWTDGNVTLSTDMTQYKKAECTGSYYSGMLQ